MDYSGICMIYVISDIFEWSLRRTVQTTANNTNLHLN